MRRLAGFTKSTEHPIGLSTTQGIPDHLRKQSCGSGTILGKPLVLATRIVFLKLLFLDLLQELSETMM